jgi:hypothetical protein
LCARLSVVERKTAKEREGLLFSCVTLFLSFIVCQTIGDWPKDEKAAGRGRPQARMSVWWRKQVTRSGSPSGQCITITAAQGLVYKQRGRRCTSVAHTSAPSTSRLFPSAHFGASASLTSCVRLV